MLSAAPNPAAGKDAQFNLRLAELRALRRDSDRACHRRFATAAQSVAVDGRYHRLAEILDEVERRLPVA